jgi:hypothetical protein
VSALTRSTRGSAVVETILAFPVVFTWFMGMVQLAYLEVASLTTKHAAVAAARAAVVVAADDPKYYGSAAGTLDGERGAEVDEAVVQILRTAAVAPNAHVTFPDGLAEGTVVRAHVDFDYPCTVPVGGLFVCGPRRVAHLRHDAFMPSQTAGYVYP